MMTRPTLRELEGAYIVAVYNETKNKHEASRILGVSVRTIYNRLDDLKADGLLLFDEIKEEYYFTKPLYKRIEDPSPVRTKTINEICNEIYEKKYAIKEMEN